MAVEPPLPKSVLDNVAGGSEKITVQGRSRHVLSYLKDFLFTPERARQPVRALSGGERNRVLLAKLFTRPANVLVMDEPTNDLDVETLELLEELLGNFEGTLLLVSHDRALLNAVVTSTLVFEGEGRLREYVGGYDEWLRQRPDDASGPPPEKSRKPAQPKAASSASRPPGKLSYKEQRELDALPACIEALEGELSALHGRMAESSFYQEGGEAIAAAKDRLAQLEGQLGEAYARWEELEGQKP